MSRILMSEVARDYFEWSPIQVRP